MTIGSALSPRYLENFPGSQSTPARNGSALGGLGLPTSMVYSTTNYRPGSGGTAGSERTSKVRLGTGSANSSEDNSPKLCGEPAVRGNAADLKPSVRGDQGEIWTNFGEYSAPLIFSSYTQPACDMASFSTWEGEPTVGEGGDIMGIGSLEGNGGGDISGGGAESNDAFTDTAFTTSASYSPAPVSSSPMSPNQHQNNKRSKKPKTVDARPSPGDSSGSYPTTSSSGSSSAERQRAAQAKRQLRTASRTSRNTCRRPNETGEERRSRDAHNVVEKEYRNRLNAQFEGLLRSVAESEFRDVLEAGVVGGVGEGGGGGGEQGSGGGSIDIGALEKRLSKAEVLSMAQRHISFLERRNDALDREQQDLESWLCKYEQEAII